MNNASLLRLVEDHCTIKLLIGQVWLQDQSMYSVDMEDGFRLVMVQDIIH